MQRDSYYVHFIDDDPPRTYGPYDLKVAKDFARIGSQTGGRRTVTEGERGHVVRLYERGYRRQPRGLSQRLPPALREAWTRPVLSRHAPEDRLGWMANPTAPSTFPGPWDRSDSPELQNHMAVVIWGNALTTYANYVAEDHRVPFGFVPSIVEQLSDKVPSAARIDAARYLTDLKRANGGRPWWDIANELGVDDLDEFAYYVVQQTEGAGVAWSDSHEETLITGYDEAMNASGPASSQVERLARQYPSRNPGFDGNHNLAQDARVRTVERAMGMLGGEMPYEDPEGWRNVVVKGKRVGGHQAEVKLGYKRRRDGEQVTLSYAVTQKGGWYPGVELIEGTFEEKCQTSAEGIAEHFIHVLGAIGVELSGADEIRQRLEEGEI
ncbi:MAG: hypothetical protein COZ05_01510 [Armatimonadetes bacterium CG_4_10_14_3_um_filter_59_10]|nr:MAG: hypothetical protein COZ05_01510 [Armatimonadetes bacterium CG_4_10_14_3_um_filter_59_10]